MSIEIADWHTEQFSPKKIFAQSLNPPVMQNKSALLLSLTAAAAAAALSGCVSTGPVDPERAAKHTPEYQYQKKLGIRNKWLI